MNYNMKRFTNLSLIFGFIALFIIVTPSVFAQDDVNLPEPVYSNNVRITPILSGTSNIWLPNFEDIVYYLWNFDSSEDYTVQFLSDGTYAQAAASDAPVPTGIRNNRYFMESVRLTNLAQMSFEEGDYDGSKQYSDEAIRYANLSDDFVNLQLKIKDTDDAIAAARQRLEWAGSSGVNAASRFPNEYSQAQAAYTEATNLRTQEQWDNAIAAASRVINALAMVTEAPPAPPPEPAPVQVATPPPAPVITPPQPVPAPVQVPVPAAPVAPSVYPLPAQYTVRPWADSKDCLWNIAGRPWAYNDPRQWRLLYNANKSKMPQADNPDLIHPGMVLDIPSINGETRSGMWVDGRSYSPLK
ncbi:MAG: hypothetical protein FWF22_05365 [Treponema sp.]|nr:hypothetical protein [Treponema sp.]